MPGDGTPEDQGVHVAGAFVSVKVFRFWACRRVTDHSLAFGALLLEQRRGVPTESRKMRP